MDRSALTQLLAGRLGLAAPADGSESADPLMSALMAQMLNRPTAAEDEADDLPEDDPRDAEIERLRRTVAHLKQQLAAADRIARYIAESFGACPRCWGLNRLCPECGGRGQPGYAQPDLAELRSWVGPALHKGGWRLTKETQGPNTVPAAAAGARRAG